MMSRIIRVLLLICFVASCAPARITPSTPFHWSTESGPTHSGHYRSVIAADLNGDGFSDIVAGSSLPGGVTVWTGDGGGKWRLAPKPPLVGDVRAIAVGDVNSDGREDLMFGGQRDLKGVAVFHQSEAGEWIAGRSPAEAGSYDSLKCLDINNDGHLDIVAANSSGELVGGVQVWLGDGRGNWPDEVGPDASNIYRDVDAADLNGDGHLDIVSAAWGYPGGIHLFLGSGDGAWSSFPTPAPSGDFWGIEAADLNGDGWIDIAATTYYEGIRIWYGDGMGGWEAATFPVTTGFYWDIMATDFNDDGRADLVATSVNSNGVKVWLAHGLGNWSVMEEGIPGSGAFYGAAGSDVNGDGREDLIAASYSEGIQVWLAGREGEVLQAAPTVKPSKKSDDPQAVPFRAVTRFGIPFEADGTALAPSGENVIAGIAARLDSSKVENIRVEGHAESTEKPAGDMTLMTLSESRAGKVAQALKERFSMPGERLTVTGFADSRPPEASMADAGVTGRRVDVIVTHERGVDDRLEPDASERERQTEFMAQQTLSNEYRIGPGDLLKVVFWKQFSADEFEVLVRPDGTLSFSMVEDLKVSGLTLTELDHLLTEQLTRYFKNPRVDIMIKEHHSQQVLVMGAINSLIRQPTGPGLYVLSKPTRLVELLTVAGGPSSTANLKKVAVTRKNGTTLYVNVYKAIFQSDLSQDIPVFPGDSIFVPETSEGVSKIYVFGEVEKPGIYDLKDGMTVLEAVGKAGSYTADAVLASTKLIRGDLSKPEVISVDLKKFFQAGNLSANLALQNNDIVYVPKTRIASLSHFLKNLQPALDFVLFPLQFEALRTTIDLNEENLRFFEPTVP